jgi:hypothetical protein
MKNIEWLKKKIDTKEKKILAAAVLLLIFASIFALAQNSFEDKRDIRTLKNPRISDVTERREEMPFLNNTATATIDEFKVGRTVLILGRDESTGVVVADALVLGGTKEELEALAPNRMASTTAMGENPPAGNEGAQSGDVDREAMRAKMQEMSQEERQAFQEERGVQGSGSNTASGRGGTGRVAMTQYVGTVTSVSENDMTLSLEDGKSVLVIYSTRTKLAKTE